MIKLLIINILFSIIFSHCHNGEKQKNMFSISKWEQANLFNLDLKLVKADEKTIKQLILDKKTNITSNAFKQDRFLFIENVLSQDSLFRTSDFEYLIVESESSGERNVSIIDLFIKTNNITTHFLYELEFDKWQIKKQEVTDDKIIDKIFNTSEDFNLNETLYRHFSIIITYYSNRTESYKSNVLVCPSNYQIEKLLNSLKFLKQYSNNTEPLVKPIHL